MQAKLIIFLHSDDLTHPSWVLVDAYSMVEQIIHYGNPEELASKAINKEITVLVPAEDVLLTTVTLPNMNRSRLAQVLPYALEEQLTCEVDKLHFAIAEQKDYNHLPVAIVSHDKMQAWKMLLASWGIQADSFTPASLALPAAANEWHIAMNQMALVRTGLYHAFACDQANLKQLLSIALSSASPIPDLIYIHYYSSSAVLGTAEANVAIKEEISEPEKYLADLAQQIIKFPVINLLQGPYRVKKTRLLQREKMRRAITYLAAAWLLLLASYPTVSYFMLMQRRNNIENQITQIYKRNFPQASNVVAPKLRMQEKLQKLNAQLGEHKLLSLLAVIANGKLMVPGLSLKRLDFQNSQLTLALLASSSDDIAMFTDYLMQQGLDVKQQNANLTDNKVSATLVIG